MAIKSATQEILKSLGKLFINDDVLPSYIGLRVYREGTINYGTMTTPYVTIEIDWDTTRIGLPSENGNIKVSVWNSTKNSENKRTSEEIAARIYELIDGDDGRDNINQAGQPFGFTPHLLFINKQNGFFMPVEQDTLTRYVQNFAITVKKQ